MLECRGLSKHFDGVVALDQVDLTVGAGEIVGVIGPNGSGKSTLVNAVSGFLEFSGGDVLLGGESLKGMRPTDVRRMGLARTFQNLRLIEPISVLDNLLVGLHLKYAGNRDHYWQWLPAVFGGRRARRVDRESREIAYGLLEQVGLADKASERVSNLPYGQKKRLELARVIALEPRMLLLDEPTAGLEPSEAHELVKLIVDVVAASSDRGLLLIEHRLEMVFDLCDRVAVLDSGRKVAEGSPEVIANDREVIRVYIGDEGASDAVDG